MTLESDDTMIASCRSRDYVPFGREFCSQHPGPVSLQLSDNKEPHRVPLLKALKDISINVPKQHDHWTMRSSPGGERTSEEELYIKGNSVVWSRGGHNETHKVIKTYTMNTPVKQAFWGKFILSSSEENDKAQEIQNGVCIIESHSVSVYTDQGEDYVAALPFEVSRAWKVKNGVLFERSVVQNDVVNKDTQPLPIWFNMTHPLDEISPVISKSGLGGSYKVDYERDHSHHIVFCSEDPSIVMSYDSVIGTHSIWRLRKAKTEEGYSISGYAMDSTTGPHSHPSTPHQGMSHSSHSRLTLSSQSPSLSPFHSRHNSPAAHSRSLSSPSITHMAALSRSPSLNAERYHRIHTPSPKGVRVGLARTPVSHSQNVSLLNESFGDYVEPLTPEICLEHLWTEKTSGAKEGVCGRASKAFLSTDINGTKFLCYLVPSKQQLRCLKFTESNDQSQLILGTVSILTAVDAVPITSLNMIVVLEPSNSLVIYTGTSMINKIHIAGLPASSLSVSGLILPSIAITNSPRRSSLITSSRPTSAMDAKFGDEEMRLSPVPSEMNDSSLLLQTSLTEEFSLYTSSGSIVGLRDEVTNKFTIELTDGSMMRIDLPEMSTTTVVQTCLASIKHVLPRDISLQVLIRWYIARNPPGGLNGQPELTIFIRCLLNLAGYDIGKLPLTRQADLDSSLSPVLMTKKARTLDEGSNDDWAFLLSSSHHKVTSEREAHLLGLSESLGTNVTPIQGGVATVDVKSLLFPHLPSLLFALHIAYEELKLDVLLHDQLESLAPLLLQLSRDMKCTPYIDHYCRDWSSLFTIDLGPSQLQEDQRSAMLVNPCVSKDPPSIYNWLYRFLNGAEVEPYPYVPAVSLRTKKVISLYAVMSQDNTVEPTWEKFLKKIGSAGSWSSASDLSKMSMSRTFNVDSNTVDERVTLCMTELGMLMSRTFNVDSNTVDERVTLCMTELGMTIKDVDRLPLGVGLPLREAIFNCRKRPATDWSEEAFVLIGREDLARQAHNNQEKHSPPPGSHPTGKSSKEDEADGMDHLDKEMLRLRFSDDLRVQEVRRLLQSSKPARVSLTQRPEVSDHDFIEEQEKYLYATCIRTMALPLGRGMFTLCTYHPIATETLPIPKLILTGRAPPRNTTIDLSHIDTPTNMSLWPSFHNGMAAGLRIANSSQIDSTWIIYNKPKTTELSSEHAGFLMALGLNGHLANLATMNVHDYLCKGHELTSIGLLLGISAAKRASMDLATVRLLSIHIPALLPPCSTELDVPHNVQVAAVIGVGLIYQGTAHRHVAEVLLSEIGRLPGPDMENCSDRESYSLSAGLALGLVMLGKGTAAIGLADLNMADVLHHFMAGGHKRQMPGANKERFRSPSCQIKEGDSVNVDVTSPGATLALGMMFFGSNNSAVAHWLEAPDTQFLLDFVRPDFLLLRVISRGLVMWHKVLPTRSWVEGNLPKIVQQYGFKKCDYKDDPECDIDFETMSQAMCNLVAGGCMTIALKFAGTSNQSAYKTLLTYAKEFMDLLSQQTCHEQSGKSALENSLVVIVLSLALVMAGSGDLEVLRICRHLRQRVGQQYGYVTYGSHMAIAMATSLLFIGGGRYSFSTKPEAVAAMICAFYPKFPTHSNDNRYHLQALRHLYVLAAEPRLVFPRDVDDGHPCYAPITVRFKDTESYTNKSYQTFAPCVLPQLDALQEVSIKGPRYWPVEFHEDKNWKCLQQLLQQNGELFVKQRAGHLSYNDDPKGYRSLLAKSFTNDQSGSRAISAEIIKSFSSDDRVLLFAKHFCKTLVDKEYVSSALMSSVLHECLTQEKLEMLSSYIAIDQTTKRMWRHPSTLELAQIKLVLAYYRTRRDSRLIQEEFLAVVKNDVDKLLDNWLKTAVHVVISYLKGQPLSGSDSMLLSSFLLWHDIPQPSLLAQIPITGVPSFPELFTKLKSLNLSVNSVMRLLHVWQSAS